MPKLWGKYSPVADNPQEHSRGLCTPFRIRHAAYCVCEKSEDQVLAWTASLKWVISALALDSSIRLSADSGALFIRADYHDRKVVRDWKGDEVYDIEYKFIEWWRTTLSLSGGTYESILEDCIYQYFGFHPIYSCDMQDTLTVTLSGKYLDPELTPQGARAADAYVWKPKYKLNRVAGTARRYPTWVDIPKGKKSSAEAGNPVVNDPSGRLTHAQLEAFGIDVPNGSGTFTRVFNPTHCDAPRPGGNVVGQGPGSQPPPPPPTRDDWRKIVSRKPGKTVPANERHAVPQKRPPPLAPDVLGGTQPWGLIPMETPSAEAQGGSSCGGSAGCSVYAPINEADRLIGGGPAGLVVPNAGSHSPSEDPLDLGPALEPPASVRSWQPLD